MQTTPRTGNRAYFGGDLEDVEKLQEEVENLHEEIGILQGDVVQLQGQLQATTERELLLRGHDSTSQLQLKFLRASLKRLQYKNVCALPLC